MRSPHVVWSFALALGLILSGREALSGPRAATNSIPLTGVPHRSVWLPGTDQTLPICRVGEHGDPFKTENVVYYDGTDSYYTWMRVLPESCSACPAGGVYAKATAAHLALYFPTAPDTVGVTVDVVGVVPATCRFQDAAITVCDPFTVSLDSQDPAITIDFAIPIPNDCGLYTAPFGTGQAFLAYTFMSSTDTTLVNKPKLVVQLAGKTCYSYNPVGFINYDFVAEFQTGNPLMYLDVTQCDLVPVKRKSWGQLKLHYR